MTRVHVGYVQSDNGYLLCISRVVERGDGGDDEDDDEEEVGDDEVTIWMLQNSEVFNTRQPRLNEQSETDMSLSMVLGVVCACLCIW